MLWYIMYDHASMDLCMCPCSYFSRYLVTVLYVKAGIFLENRFRGGKLRFLNIEGGRIYHLNADYSTSWLLTSVDATLRTTQGGQRHFQGRQNAPFASP